MKRIIDYMVYPENQRREICDAQIDLRNCNRYLTALSEFARDSTEIDDLMMDVGHAITEKIHYTPVEPVYESPSEESNDEA